MASTSYVSKGVTVSFGTMAGFLLDVNLSGESADIVDVTQQASTSGWREFKVGFVDAGGGSLTVLYDPDAAVDATGTSGTLLVTWPTGSTKKYSASAILSGLSAAAPLGDKIVQTLEFKITGVSNWGST